MALVAMARAAIGRVAIKRIAATFVMANVTLISRRRESFPDELPFRPPFYRVSSSVCWEVGAALGLANIPGGEQR
jgi:hypothetical protein